MTWTEANLVLQLLAEERVGASRRRQALEARAIEDATAAAVADAVSRT